MMGIGEYYLPAFAIALHMGDVVAGLIATVPMLSAALLQLVTPVATRALGWHRRWVVLGAALQALSFVPLIIGAWTARMPALLLFAVVTLYQFGAMAGGPVWSTWIPLLVPTRLRAHYFAYRNRWCQAGILAGLVGGGLLLKVFGADPVRAFVALFAVAAACRAVSSALLSLQSEPRPMPLAPRAVSTSEMLSRVRHGPDGRFLLYAVSVMVALQIAQPFFNPYMLRRFDDMHYAVLLGAAFVGRIVAMPAIATLARRRGARAVLWAGGLGLVPGAAAWLVSDNFWWLLAVQLLSGAAWAAHELGLFLMNVETIHEDERASVLSKFNLMNALATAGGSALGGMMLGALGEQKSAYFAVFIASAVARAAALPLLSRVGRARHVLGAIARDHADSART